MQKNPFIEDGVELQVARFLWTARSGDRRRRHRRLALRDQLALPEEPFDLPETEAEAQQDDRYRKHGRPEQRAKPGHTGQVKTRAQGGGGVPSSRRSGGSHVVIGVSGGNAGSSRGGYCGGTGPPLRGRTTAPPP